MIKIRCVICGKEIINPRMNQKTCGKSCSSKCYDILYPNRLIYQRKYQKALSELRRRHREEFLNIFKSIKRR